MLECEYREQIPEMVEGRLEPDRAEQLLDHIAGCELCLETADELWAGRSELALLMQIQDEIPDPSEAELRLMKQVARSDLGGESILLITQGFFKALLALLEPFMALFGNSRSSR